MDEKKYAILAISESWLNSSVRNAEVEIDGYNLSRLATLRNMKAEIGSGVCMYVCKNFKCNILLSLRYCISAISDAGFHQLWIQVQHKKLKSFLLCATYKPPDCCVACFEDFSDCHTQVLVYSLPILVVKDFNCDLLDSFSKSRALNTLCASLNIKELITPTREAETSKLSLISY